MEQVKSVLEHTRSISRTVTASEVGISPASVYSILTNCLRKQKVCAKWTPHMLNNDQTAIHVLLATIHLQCWRNEGNAFLNHIVT
jgi:hypothetical protein